VRLRAHPDPGRREQRLHPGRERRVGQQRVDLRHQLTGPDQLGNAGAELVGPGELVPQVGTLLSDPALTTRVEALLTVAGVGVRAQAHAA